MFLTFNYEHLMTETCFVLVVAARSISFFKYIC